MSIKHFDVEFTRDGAVHDHAQVAQLLDGAMQFSDLLVLSHGWNNDMADARELYDKLTASVSQVLASGAMPELAQRQFGVMRIFWPSKKFADEDLIPGGGAASATQENDDALVRILEAMKNNPRLLGGHDVNPVRTAVINAVQALIPKLETDLAAQQEFVLQLRSLLDPSSLHPEDGSEEFFTRSPQEIFEGLDGNVAEPMVIREGGATSLSDDGGAVGLGDLLSGIKAAARRIANFTTYCEMKQRAGLVGSAGVASVLVRLRDRRPQLRLHLAGHSFGGRVVTAAAHALPNGTNAVTLSLLQAAFSHNGFAAKYDGEHDGAFRQLLSQSRVSGPILITHTKNDRAVGIAYPLASRLSRDPASAFGDENDPYGGMGRNGAQHTIEVEGL
ncbi:MAG: hypothetical protein Q7T25_10310, partial [Sideroxyarcus sp.]|nr:hypothetical protein [Sideroxyarcus sp.]